MPGCTCNYTVHIHNLLHAKQTRFYWRLPCRLDHKTEAAKYFLKHQNAFVLMSIWLFQKYRDWKHL